MKDNYNSLGTTGLVVKVARIVSNERVMVKMAALTYSSCSVALVGLTEALCGTEKGVKGFQ